MFSKESARHADACRFCWMCRHICPVAGSTGNEGWTPRARGLMVSMIERGTTYDADIAEVMYHCTLCDACANDCATGYKPSEFVREARTLAVVENIAPKAVMTAIDTIESSGNIFGSETDHTVLDAIGDMPDEAGILLFLGQTARTVAAQVALSAIALLRKANVPFTVLSEEPASGAYMGELMGFTGDVQAMAVAAADKIAAAKAKTLVVLNPADAVMFRDEYGKYGLLGGVEVVTATAFISKLIDDGALRPAASGLTASLQEPVKLTRGLDELEPFKKIAAAAGIGAVDMYLNGKMSRCIGTVPFDMYAPSVVSDMVNVRCEDARRLGSRLIVTASPDDYYLMSKYAESAVRIVDIYGVLNNAC